MTIPGVAELLGLTIASEIGDISRFPSARKLVGYSGLTPRIKQSGQSSRTGRLSKAGPDTLRWAAVEASQQAWRPTNPWHRALHRHQAPPRQGQPRQGRRRPQGPDRLLAHPLAQRAVQAQRRRALPILSRQAPPFVWPPEAHKRSEKPGQLPPDHVRRQAPKEISAPAARQDRPELTTRRLTHRTPSKRRMAGRPRLPQPEVDGHSERHGSDKEISLDNNDKEAELIAAEPPTLSPTSSAANSYG